MSDAQLDLLSAIDAVDKDLAGFPVRVPGYQKLPPVSRRAGVPPQYALDIVPDGYEYTRVMIACPEGWTRETTPGGARYLADAAGHAHLIDAAVAAGLVKIAAVAPMPDVHATSESKEKWGGR